MGLLKHPLKFAILLAAGLLLTGCVVDPYDGYAYPYGYDYGYGYYPAPVVGVYGGYYGHYGYYGHGGYGHGGYGHGGYYHHWR